MRSYVNNIVKTKQGSILTLQQAKEQLNVEEDFLEDDEHILFLIEAARSEAEDYTGIDIALTTNTLEFINFSDSAALILECPYKTITSITKTVAGVDTVINPADYTVEIRRTYFYIMFKEQITADKVVMVFTTGYNKDEAPMSIQQAMLVKIADMYDVERTSYTTGTNYRDNGTFRRLLNAHVVSRW